MIVFDSRPRTPLTLDRFEACLSLVFSGMRLAISGIGVLGVGLAMFADPHEPRALWLAVIAGVGLVFVAEIVLIRVTSDVLDEPDSGKISIRVAERVRAWRAAARLPLAFAYTASTGLTFVITYFLERNWFQAFQLSRIPAGILGFVVAMSVSYSANLTLLAAMSAMRAPPSLVNAAFRTRLLIDAAAGLLTAVLLIRR